ncbi:MAG TPA: sigma-54 dependent transcriptional regulator [Thermoanaerobaculia bacterium]|nr:sigma-54 dependent transcriptional regulator [Thermoanaerobaculia bacterium]
MRALVFSTDGLFAAPSVLAALGDAAWEISEAADELELLAIAGNGDVDLIAIQTSLAPAATLALARRVRQLDRHVTLCLLVTACEADFVLAAMRAGVNDLLTCASTDEEIADVVGRVIHHEPAARPQTELIAGNRLVGHSKPIEQLRRSIQRVATCDSNVLITGETGTGKELTAELIHANSRRRDRPFVSINCAAIPEGLLESELFGYERGAFTGAHAAREGKLQYAQGGTLFLDEVGDMTLYAQAKILRVIESRKLQRLGGNRDIAVNIRIIAATNQNLEQLTSQQKFRQDLFFRLNVARLHLPPLREHADDIPELVREVVRELAARVDRRIDTVDPTFIEPLLRYGWPGNIRELRNVVESTIVFGSSNRVTRRDLPPYLRALFASEERKRDSEREQIVGALRASEWNRNDAARLLGCSRMTLYRKMVKYDLFTSDSAMPAPARKLGA